jgi:phosphohistidine phosphatase
MVGFILGFELKESFVMKTRTLILMRHGKAEKDGPSDHERRLADKGRDQSINVGKSLKKLFGALDRAVVSDSTRTRQTLAQVLIEVPIHKIILEEKLYTINSQREFSDALSGHLADTEKNLLIVGHNPTISSLASYYTDQNIDLGTGDYIIATIETSDWATALESGGSWGLKYPG